MKSYYSTFLDQDIFRLKPAATVVSARRAGKEKGVKPPKMEKLHLQILLDKFIYKKS